MRDCPLWQSSCVGIQHHDDLEHQIDRNPPPFLDSFAGALGWNLFTYFGVPMVVRDGNLGGFSATMAFVLAANVGVPVLVNADALGGPASVTCNTAWSSCSTL